MESITFSTLTCPSEADQRLIEGFFRSHCLSSQERLGRLDVDCWSVTRRLVNYILEKDPTEMPHRIRWIIRRPSSKSPLPRENKSSHSIKRRIARIFRRLKLLNPRSVEVKRTSFPDKDEKGEQSRFYERRKNVCPQVSERLMNSPNADVISEISHWVVEWKGYIIDPTIMQFVQMNPTNEDMNHLRARCYNENRPMTFKSCSDIHPPWVSETISRGRLYAEYARNVTRTPYFFGTEKDHPIRSYAEVVRIGTRTSTE